MENELKTNAVKLSPEEQYQIRKSMGFTKTGRTNAITDKLAEIELVLE